MSAVQTSEYRVICPVCSHPLPFPYVLQRGLDLVDVFKTRTAAEYACQLLNSGLATVDPHAVLGCKVVAR